ncbi:hypothetical protein F4802DRAFT_597164 [Xylaria palmicola]|nr:hypothetical protein F4802DRAFT_597164 [Xylaria palmicola]
MSQPPAAPAKVPAAAATYTAATQDPDLRSQINSLLIREGHAAKIQERFLHSLDAHNSNWPSTLQSHALALLRSGEVSTFPALVRRVLEDVQRDTATANTSAAASSSSSSTNNNTASNTQTSSAPGTSDSNKDGVNGTTVVNGNSRAAGGVNGNSAGVSTDATANLAIPSSVIEAVLKVVRESLESLCEIEPDGSAGG